MIHVLEEDKRNVARKIYGRQTERGGDSLWNFVSSKSKKVKLSRYALQAPWVRGATSPTNS
jgi:hypothetical protein